MKVMEYEVRPKEYTEIQSGIMFGANITVKLNGDVKYFAREIKDGQYILESKEIQLFLPEIHLHELFEVVE